MKHRLSQPRFLPRLSRHLVMTFIAMTCLTGCAAAPNLKPLIASTQPRTEAVKTAEVQQALLVFVDQFIPALSEGCDYIALNSKTADVKIAAQSRKINATLAAMKNAANPNPYAGMLDMVVMVTLLSDVSDTPAAKDFFGPYGQRLKSVMDAQRREVWHVASQFVTAAQLQELRDSIKAWQDAHPERQYVSFVRLGQFPQTSQIATTNPPRRTNSVFGLLFLDPLSNLDPAVREFEQSRQLMERGFFYIQRMPIIIGWQTEQIYNQMLAAPEVQGALQTSQTVAGSTTRFSDASARFADSVETFRRDLPRFRTDTIDQAELAVARQRDAALNQATTQIASERDIAVRQVATAFHHEQKHLSDSLRKVLDQFVSQLFTRCIILIVCVMAGALVYRILISLFFRRGGATS